MFYGECYKCGERWELGTASTCKFEDEVKWDASAPLIMTPHPAFQKREWVGFTHEELAWLNEALNLGGRFAVIEAIEAKLKEKNFGNS
jgi:hypothetical protein